MAENRGIFTPIGRLVSGDLFRPNKKDMKGKPLTFRDGMPREQWFVALAVPKNEPDYQRFGNEILLAAQQAWPAGEWNKPDFRWKIMDGDDPKYSNREHYRGNHIIRMTNGYPIGVWSKDGEHQIVDPNEVKLGYYIRASVTIKSNNDSTYSGIFINVHAVELIGYGPEITIRPDGGIFKDNPATSIPSYISQTPVANGPGIGIPQGTPGTGFTSQIAVPGAAPFQPSPMPPSQPNQPSFPQSNPMPPSQPNPTLPSQPNAAQIKPAYDFLSPQSNAMHQPGTPETASQSQTSPTQSNPGQGDAAVTPGPQAPKPNTASESSVPEGYTFVSKDGPQYTYDQYIKQGWTDKMLIDNKYLVPLENFPPF